MDLLLDAFLTALIVRLLLFVRLPRFRRKRPAPPATGATPTRPFDRKKRFEVVSSDASFLYSDNTKAMAKRASLLVDDRSAVLYKDGKWRG